MTRGRTRWRKIWENTISANEEFSSNGFSAHWAMALFRPTIWRIRKNLFINCWKTFPINSAKLSTMVWPLNVECVTGDCIVLRSELCSAVYGMNVECWMCYVCGCEEQKKAIEKTQEYILKSVCVSRTK